MTICVETGYPCFEIVFSNNDALIMQVKPMKEAASFMKEAASFSGRLIITINLIAMEKSRKLKSSKFYSSCHCGFENLANEITVNSFLFFFVTAIEMAMF